MLLILCPLPIELNGVLDALTQDGFEVREITTHHTRYICESLGWILSTGGHGKTQFAIQTQYLLHQHPQITGVICLGACGSLSSQVKPLDLVIATHTIEHDFKTRFLPKPPPRFTASEELLASLERPIPSVHFGAVASGDEDIIDPQRARELAELTGAIAVAWEGAGGARVCKFLEIPYLEIRGVTDSADGNALAHFKTNVSKVMATAYALIKKSFAKPS